MCSGDWTQVINLDWQMPLPVEPPCWPSMGFRIRWRLCNHGWRLLSKGFHHCHALPTALGKHSLVFKTGPAVVCMVVGVLEVEAGRSWIWGLPGLHRVPVQIGLHSETLSVNTHTPNQNTNQRKTGSCSVDQAGIKPMTLLSCLRSRETVEGCWHAQVL